MRPSARSTEELGSGLTSVRRCAPVVAACTLLRSGIGLERHGRRLLGLVAFRGFLRRVDDHLHASGAAGRACAGGGPRRFPRLPPSFLRDSVGRGFLGFSPPPPPGVEVLELAAGGRTPPPRPTPPPPPPPVP